MPSKGKLNHPHKLHKVALTMKCWQMVLLETHQMLLSQVIAAAALPATNSGLLKEVQATKRIQLALVSHQHQLNHNLLSLFHLILNSKIHLEVSRKINKKIISHNQTLETSAEELRLATIRISRSSFLLLMTTLPGQLSILVPRRFNSRKTNTRRNLSECLKEI